MKIGFCGQCGTPLGEGSNFCTNCGWKLPDEGSRRLIESQNQFRQGSVASPYIMPSGPSAPYYGTQAAPAMNRPKKKFFGRLITLLVMIFFIAAIVGVVQFFVRGNVKAEKMSGIWSIEFIVTDMSDDKDYYDYSDYIGETTEGTLTVELDEDGKGTAKLVSMVEGIEYDYSVMDAQYKRGKLVCTTDTTSESMTFTGNVRKKGDAYQLSGKFKIDFIEDVKTFTSGKWTATKDINETDDTMQGKSKKEKNDKSKASEESIPNLAVNATILDVIGEWEGTAILSSFTGYEENRALFMEKDAPEDVIEQFDNMKGKESPINLEVDEDYGWDVSMDVAPLGNMSISDSNFGYDENGEPIDGTMKIEKGKFHIVNSEKDEGVGSATFDFNGYVLTNDDGSYALKGSLILSLVYDEGTAPLEMVFDYDMQRSVNTEE